MTSIETKSENKNELKHIIMSYQQELLKKKSFLYSFNFLEEEQNQNSKKYENEKVEINVNSSKIEGLNKNEILLINWHNNFKPMNLYKEKLKKNLINLKKNSKNISTLILS